MPYKVLGQLAATTTATAVYTVPASTETVVSTITVANRSASARTYRIILRPNDEALDNKHYLAYDVSIAASDTVALTLGITMDATDKLYVSGSTNDLTFNVFGSEKAV